MAEEGVNHAEPQTIGQKVAAQGALEAQEALKAALQLVRCVSQLHTEGRIHRRICADTVLYDEAILITLKPTESVVMIGGIGVDQVPCPPQFHQVPPFSLPMETEAAKEALTQNGLLLDPHQLDYYQIGALLCFMASALNVADYLRSCKAKAQVPQVVRPIIDRALGLNSKECFDSAEAFAAAIEAALSGAPVPADSWPETAGEALPFETLGHYEIIELIGHGGMGDVYKGYEKNLDRFVALKVLPAELGRHKDFVKRFHAEAASLAKIDHPNIVRIYYSGQDQGRHFFAMQYIEGQSLAEVLGREQKLSVAEALPIVRQCLVGLSAVHQHGLVHRDIKPGNVLLERATDRALLTDFGVAKTLYAGTQMTVTGTIMGTADYIAPEQARGGEVDGRADLYSVGVLMYQMLSGKLPFEAKSATSMMFQHAYEPPLPLSEAAPDVPAHIVGIVMKLMAKEPDRRYQTAEEVLAALSAEDFSASLPYQFTQTADTTSSSFGWTEQTQPTLSGFAVIRNRLIGLRNRIWGLLGFVSPHLAESMQTTCQQVDGAVQDYQRRRDTLSACAKEARAMAVDLQVKAVAARNAASAATRRLETAADTAAKQQALKEKEDNEQAAAELAQLAAEQKQQADEIDLRLATVNATLNRLCTQRDALNARLKLANARNKAEGAAPKRWSIRPFSYAVLVLMLAGFGMVFLMMHGKKIEKNVFIVSFRPKDATQFRTYKELLDEFGRNYPAGVKTYRYRTKVQDNRLVGYICTDTQADVDAITEMLKTSDTLEFVNVTSPTPEEFQAHCSLKFVDLPSVAPEITQIGTIKEVIPLEDVKIDSRLIGTWQSVDFVKTIDAFKPNQQQWRGGLYLKGLTFFEDGTTSGPWFWKNGSLYHPGDNTYAQCIIKILDGTPYLFMEWMSGDVTIRGMKPSYYVMKKHSAPMVAVVNTSSPVIFCEGLAVDGIAFNDPTCTIEFVESRLGPPQERRLDGRQLVYLDNTIRFNFSSNGSLSEIHLNQGFKGRLSTGISLNSSKQDVFRVYGEPVATITKPSLNRVNIDSTLCILERDPQVSRIYYGQHSLIFWFQNDSINQIVPFKGHLK